MFPFNGFTAQPRLQLLCLVTGEVLISFSVSRFSNLKQHITTKRFLPFNEISNKACYIFSYSIFETFGLKHVSCPPSWINFLAHCMTSQVE